MFTSIKTNLQIAYVFTPLNIVTTSQNEIGNIQLVFLPNSFFFFSHEYVYKPQNQPPNSMYFYTTEYFHKKPKASLAFSQRNTKHLMIWALLEGL